MEAVKQCKSKSNINIVLMDIKMQVMDGYKAVRKIREFNKDLIIIAQTVYALSGELEKALEAGCNDHISKPFNKNELLELIPRYIKHK